MRYLVVSFFSVISLLLQAQITENIDIDKNDVHFSHMDGYDIISWDKNTLFTEKVGAPQLPVIVESFVVPMNAKVLGINVNIQTKNRLTGSFLIIPTAPRISTNSRNSSIYDYQDSLTYNSSLPYPQNVAKIISDEYEHGYHVVTIEICPFEYIPQEKILYLLKLSFTINYDEVETGYEYPLRQSSKQFDLARSYISSKVKNKDDVHVFSNQKLQIINKESRNLNEVVYDSTVGSTLDNMIPEYLIITDQKLKSVFQKLVDWKTKKGVPAKIITKEEITIQSEGVDLAEKIRNYLKDCRRKWGDDFFVLLGGDTNIIPDRIATNGTDRKDEYKKEKDEYIKDSLMTSQDLYYTALDGNWNTNNNHVYNQYYQYQMSDKYPSMRV